MKALLLTLLCMFAAGAAFAQGDVYELWPVTVSMPVLYSGSNSKGQPATLTTTLKNDDIINLALGQARSTKINPKDDILALAGDASTPGVGSSIIILNPTTKAEVAPVFSLPVFDVLFANPPADTSAVVYATATVTGTSAGLNGFDDSSSVAPLAIAGTGKLSGKLSVTSTALCGPIWFHTTGTNNVTTSYQGVVIRGSLKVTAGSLGTLQ